MDLEAILEWHVFAYTCILLGYFRDVPQGNTNGGNSQSDDDKPKGNSALDIHLDLHVMAYLQANEVFGGIDTQGVRSSCPQGQTILLGR